MAISTRLTSKGMIALGAMALITLCFQTFNSSSHPSTDAPTLARLETIDRQIITLRATINQILKEKDMTIHNISWPAKTPASNSFIPVLNIVFGLFAFPALIAASVTFYEEAGDVAQRTFAVGLWTACAVFIALWHIGRPQEWYVYFLGATWGLYGGMFLSVFFTEDTVPVDEQKI
jgi:hypothetical protein